ncbi:MAG: exodeoxyribonuclease III [Candidatus Thermoplasmatota archaeon]|nr:exodeoxyribonuclease III [Candidatus Thermoplasmatota archaeon]
MELLSWNVNGIRAVERKGFLDWLGDRSPDIFCAQETKAHPDQLSEKLLDFSDYHKHFSSAEKKGYSGVSTWTKKEPKEVENGLGIDRFDSEGRTLITHFDGFVLFNIYFPNGKKDAERLQYKIDFYDAFQEKIEEYRKQGKNVVSCGDVNTAHREIDLSRPKENSKVSGFLPIEREWIDGLLSLGYLDTFREFHEEGEQYSWWDYYTRARERNVGWRIDYFFINSEFREHLKDAFILQEVMGSDHCPIGVQIEL